MKIYLIVMVLISLNSYSEERFTSCETVSRNNLFSMKPEPRLGTDDLEYVNKFNFINLLCSKHEKVRAYFSQISDYGFELFKNEFGRQSLLKLQRYIRQYETFEVDSNVERLEANNKKVVDYISTINLYRKESEKTISVISRCITSRVNQATVISCNAIKLCESLDDSVDFSSTGKSYDQACKILELK